MSNDRACLLAVAVHFKLVHIVLADFVSSAGAAFNAVRSSLSSYVNSGNMDPIDVLTYESQPRISEQVMAEWSFVLHYNT